MRITVGKYNFNNVKDFTTHLETTYEQDKLVSGEVTLSLECDDFFQEDLNELVEFFFKPERTRLYKLELPPEQMHYQLAFDNVYLASKRQRFSREFQQKTAELVHSPISFQPPVKIRKTKKNWVEGTQGSSMGLQLQHQIQYPHLHQQQQKAAKRKRKEEVVVDAVVVAEKIRSEDLGELVDRHSLENEKWLDFAKKQFTTKTPELHLIWDRLVGKYVNQVRELDRKITHVQAAAMEQIIRDYPEFSYGLLFENLPAGFYLQQTHDGKNVLCFSEEPQYQHPEQITPLTLTPQFSQTKARNIDGSYHQFSFLNEDPENMRRYKRAFHYLLGSKSLPEQRQKAFVFFLSQLTENEAPKLELIQKLLQTVPLTDLNYQGLAHVLIHTGADGVLLLLQHLKTLHDKELFNDFNEMFLDKPENYLALISPQGFANLKKLSELNSEQNAWWISLVSQHKAAGAHTEFNDLFGAYSYFLEQLAKKKLRLPLSCALENIRHMKPALSRLLFIINNSSDPEEQLTCCAGLDLDIHGAYYASRYNHYKLVSWQMKLKPKFHEDHLDYTMPVMLNELEALLAHDDLLYEEFVMRFYRFIGEQEWAFSLDVYQKIEQEISKNQRMSVPNRVLLLNIAALVTTGRRACTATEDPYGSVKNLLHRFIATADYFDEDLSDQLSTVLPVFAGSLGSHSWETMPIADELNGLIDILLLSPRKKVPASAEQASHDFREASALALNLMGEYHDAASSVIDNYKRRFAVEETNTVPIQTFSLAALLNHLVSPSKLDTFLPNLFHDQPESLSPFIVLLSLCGDEVPKVTQEVEDDSEFETKIKMLAQAVHSMQAERREQLLSILTEINIEASYRLPTLEQLIKTVDSVAKAEEKLGALPSVENQKAAILDMVCTELPELKIGTEAVNEIEINLFSLMRQSFEEWQLYNKFADLPEKLKGYLEPWLDAHQIVRWNLKRQPQNQRMLLESLAEEEQEVKNLFGSRWFARSLSGFPQEKIQMTQVLGNEFFTKQSFIAVLKPRIETCYQSKLSAALKSLQILNKDFNDFVLRQIKGWDTERPIDEALLDLGEQLDEVSGLINSLNRIKNQNNIEFHRCISLLTDRIKSTVPGKTPLTLGQMKDLLDVLGQGKACSVASSLAVVCKILKETPKYSAEQLRNALDEVTYLTKYREALGYEAYEILLRCSFTHNLAQNSLFPLKKMIGLKSLVDVDKKHSEDLFDALINGIKKAGSDVNEQLLQDAINKTTSIIQAKADVPSLVPLLTLLMKTCTKCDKDGLGRYYNLVSKLESIEDSDLNHWAKILIVLGERATDKNIHHLLDVHAGLELNQENLQQIAKLFDYPPYPEIESFIQVLNGYVKDLMIYVDAFDKDPKSGRAPQKNAFNMTLKDSGQVLDEQFDTSQISRVIAEISNIVEGTPLSGQEQYDLAQQITYINAIGRDKPLALIVDPTTQQIKVYKDLTKVSRAELRELSDTLITVIRKPHLDVDEKLKAQLRLLAVLREQYFRVTGNLVDTTQLIAILMSLKNQQYNMLFEMDTKEGNESIAAALLTVMQWVDADGGTVDVCADNRSLMVQGYKDHAKDFFISLGIASSSIEAGSPKGTYQVGGINYSTKGDLALYRSRAQVENENLTGYKDGHPVSSNLILYGSDFSELNEKTLFHLARRPEGDGENNPYAWIYPLINEFINQEKFKTLTPGKGWSEVRDVSQLKEFLDRYASTGQHKTQLNSLPDTKFNLWINAAIEAQRFVEGEDFVIPPSKTARHSALPINQKAPQDGLTFMVHQFLHARLQKEHPDWEFVIDPEMDCIDSVSTKEFIDDYKKQGRIISISRALGRKDELNEQCGKFDMKVACKIPSHQKNKREELVKKVIVNKEAHVRAVAEAINQARDGQPVIIIAKDAYEVKLLERELKAHFSKKNIAAFTGAESVTERKEWIQNESGKQNTITIATSFRRPNTNFDTRHPKGFLAIQTYLDARNTQQIIKGLAGNDKPGKYIAIYEEHGTFLSQSWFYRSNGNRKKMLAELTELQRQQREDAAVERHYLQTVSSVQQVVLQQFQEWKEFLHLVYPKSEWRALDVELLIQRDNLIRSLSEQWVECLEHSDPQKAYPNPYVRRNENKELQTMELDEAVAAYEVAVRSIWDQQRELLKEKAKGVLVEDSVNALHCHYLDGVSLSEQLQLNRLAVRESKKEMLAEKKKTRRYVESGLEINGAMLRFADGNVDVYRDAFAKSQVKLFAADISHIIKNNPYLTKTVRSILVEQVTNATNLDILVGLLVDYANIYLPEDQFTEKYAMQPVIQELLRVYKQAGLEETNELWELKTIYFDQVAAELIDDLETTLSWAKKKNRGLGYWLERTAVTDAANAILDAVDVLKKAETLPEQRIAIRNLYKVLAKHEAQLDGVWIFSFGHKNTRTLIKETIATLDGLTAIGSLDAEFIHDCKEESLSAVMKGKLDSAIRVMEEAEISLQKNAEWKAIKDALTVTQTENHTIYAFYEMYYFLSTKVEELARKSSKLQEPVTRLRGEVRNLCEAFSQDHQELLHTSKYLTCKAEKLKEKLNGLNGFHVGNVKLKEGNNGFSTYFDLVIEGSGSHPLFHDFTQYNSRADELTKEREALKLKLAQANEQVLTLDRLIKEQLPLLKFEEKIKASAEQFPKQFQGQVNEILVLKGWVADQMPGDLSSFSENVCNSFLDRELIKTFKFPNLQAEEIDKIQDLILKIGFRDLHERMVEGTKPKTVLGSIASYVSSYVFTPENMEDWRLEFSELVNRPARNLQYTLRPDIEKKQNILSGQLDKLHQQTVEQAQSLKQQIAFLNQKIDEEEQKSGVYAMRITNVAELFEFEKQLMAEITKQKTILPPQSDLKSEELPKVTLPQVPVGISEPVKETVELVM